MITNRIKNFPMTWTLDERCVTDLEFYAAIRRVPGLMKRFPLDRKDLTVQRRAARRINNRKNFGNTLDD